jgi:hypothetical protein
MKNISYKIPVTIMKQGKRFVAYSPAFDLSTSGKSKKDVEKKFQEIINIFLEEIIEMGTFSDVLSELGWKRVQKKWNPPEIISSFSVGVRIPAFA